MQQAPVAPSTPASAPPPQPQLSANFVVAGVGGRTDLACAFPKTWDSLRQLLLEQGHKGDLVVALTNSIPRAFDSLPILQSYITEMGWTSVTVSLAEKRRECSLQVDEGNSTQAFFFEHLLTPHVELVSAQGPPARPLEQVGPVLDPGQAAQTDVCPPKFSDQMKQELLQDTPKCAGGGAHH